MQINYIAIHCAYTKPSMNIGRDEIRAWHKQRGWQDIGYHVVIKREGTIEYGRPFDMIGAHVKGYNKLSLGVCLVGGMSEQGKAEDNFTDEQFDSLEQVLTALNVLYPLAEVKGHRDFPNVNKECPCFDVASWLELRGL